MKLTRSLALFLLALFALGGILPARETCIDCHTDESLMKSLFTAPVSDGAEEGEG